MWYIPALSPCILVSLITNIHNQNAIICTCICSRIHHTLFYLNTAKTYQINAWLTTGEGIRSLSHKVISVPVQGIWDGVTVYQRHRQPVQAPTRGQPFYTVIPRNRPHLVAFYDTLWIRGIHSRPNPQLPTRGGGGGSDWCCMQYRLR